MLQNSFLQHLFLFLSPPPQQKKLFQAAEPETVFHLSILLSAASQLLG